MKTVTFYSYKGGVGRSLALSNIAIRLSEFKKRVCVLDFDLEAPGLNFKFDNYTKSKPIEKGIVDYIDEFSSNGITLKSLKDFYINLIPANNIFEKIQLIPAGNIENASYWKKLSGINWSNMFYEEESKGVQFFLDLKHKIETELKPDFLLIDSRTGITDIAGITLKLFADEVVVLAANNQENIFGSKKIIKSLIEKDNLLIGKTPRIIFILTRLPFTDTPKDKEMESSIVNRRTLEFQTELSLPDFKILVIHSDRRLEEKERPLIGDDYEAKVVSISNDYLKLFDKITSDVLTPDEILIFRNKKNAEKEFENGMREIDISKKINFFNKAVEFDSTQFKYFLNRGIAYNKLKDLTNSENDFLTALKLNEDSIQALCNLASLYGEIENFNKAIEYVEMAIDKDKNDWRSYYLKAWLYSKQKKEHESILVLSEILDNIDANIDLVLNSRANNWRILGDYQSAYKDIFRAIEINPDVALYFGTLAEIYALDSRVNEFYLNLNIALSKGIDAKSLSTAKDVYEKFSTDERFVSLMAKYSIDINEILSDNREIE